MLPTRTEIEDAAALVYRVVQPTPQIRWPLLSERCGAEVWIKHENHLPTGAFKVRGGLVYLDSIQTQDAPRGVVAATRGNHGQSVAFAAGRNGLAATIVVPVGNSPAKNRAMRAYGAILVEHGVDFQDALDHARGLAAEGFHLVPSFHPLLIRGVASYGLELLRGVPDLDVVYVPIGLGSGVCGVLAARDALGSKCEVVGVVAERAPTYALSVEAGKPVETPVPDTFADGLAVRVPNPDALQIIQRGVERVVTVSEDEMRGALRCYFHDTHNVAEGAGAAPLAALLQERGRNADRKVAAVLSGGNVDAELFVSILSESRDS